MGMNILACEMEICAMALAICNILAQLERRVHPLGGSCYAATATQEMRIHFVGKLKEMGFQMKKHLANSASAARAIVKF